MNRDRYAGSNRHWIWTPATGVPVAKVSQKLHIHNCKNTFSVFPRSEFSQVCMFQCYCSQPL